MSSNLMLHGDCLSVLPTLAAESVDFVLTDPPYLVNFRDRSGRTVANDKNGDWLLPAFTEIERVMKPDSLCASFYGWSRVDLFFAAWCSPKDLRSFRRIRPRMFFPGNTQEISTIPRRNQRVASYL